MPDTVVVGHMADSLALRTGIHAMNTKLGTVPLVQRLERYRPAYALVHTDIELAGVVRAAGGGNDRSRRVGRLQQLLWQRRERAAVTV